MRKRDCALIFLLTSLLIWPLYTVEYLNNWASIESTFIAGARHLAEHWPHPQWQPNWYLGTRWDYIYPPAIHYGPAITSKLGGVSVARGYHIYIALMYALGIVGVYVFTAVAMRSRAWAWVAAAAATLVSPSYALIEHMRVDNLGTRLWPMRLNVLVRYGEGPHMSAFAVIPFALAAAWIGLRTGERRYIGLAALGCAFTVSNNFYGATALATFFPIVVWAIFAIERKWQVFARAFAIAALAYGLTAIWLVPSYVKITTRNMALVSNPGNAWSVWLALAVCTVLAFVTWRWVKNPWLIFVIGSTALFSLNVIGNRRIGFRISGEPERLVPELDLVIILLIVTVCAWLWKRGLLGRAAVLGLAFYTVILCKGWVRRSHTYYEADPNPQARIEYRMQGWVAKNLGDTRIFVTGSVRFWFNVWRDHPQVGGGSEQGVLNMSSVYSYYATATNAPVEHAIAWLQAVGAGAVMVHDKTSEEIYHDYEQPERITGSKLKQLYSDGKGNWVYEIPRRFPERARVVDAAKVRANGAAYTVDHPEMLTNYVALIENGPDKRVRLKRIDNQTVRVEAEFAAGQGLVVQESWDHGWHAYSGGRELRVEKDPAEFILVDAGPGRHTIELRWEPPLENRVGLALTLISLPLLLWLLASRRSSSH